MTGHALAECGAGAEVQELLRTHPGLQAALPGGRHALLRPVAGALPRRARRAGPGQGLPLRRLLELEPSWQLPYHIGRRACLPQALAQFW